MNKHRHHEKARTNRQRVPETGSALHDESKELSKSHKESVPYDEDYTAMGLGVLAMVGVVLSLVLKNIFS
jgi:hypothetical protein